MKHEQIKGVLNSPKSTSKPFILNFGDEQLKVSVKALNYLWNCTMGKSTIIGPGAQITVGPEAPYEQYLGH